MRGRVRSSGSVAEQVPKNEVFSNLELVTKQNMPQQALTSSGF